jgi:periplasmic divalent cation tolerance protein
MSNSAIRLVYLTAPNSEEARAMARILIAERLAACVNILGDVDSVYRWKGEVESATETALIAKTTADRLQALIERLTSIHSYDCPCVVALPIVEGNPAFLDWIGKETTPPSNGGES